MNLTHVYKYGHIYLIRRKKGLVRIGLIKERIALQLSAENLWF